MPKLIHIWSNAEDEALAAVYRDAHGKRELSRALTEFAERIRHPRSAVLQRAQKLGIARDLRRPWTADDLSFLQAQSGRMTVKRMAKLLRRTTYAVHAKLTEEHLRRQRVGRHAKRELLTLFGVSWEAVCRWQALGWLRPDADGYYTDQALLRFIVAHPDAIDPRTVSVAWMRQTLGTLGRRLAELDRYRASDGQLRRAA